MAFAANHLVGLERTPQIKPTKRTIGKEPGEACWCGARQRRGRYVPATGSAAPGGHAAAARVTRAVWPLARAAWAGGLVEGARGHGCHGGCRAPGGGHGYIRRSQDATSFYSYRLFYHCSISFSLLNYDSMSLASTQHLRRGPAVRRNISCANTNKLPSRKNQGKLN